MTFTISLFIFGISLAFALIARKVWQFRSGRVIPGSYEPADWTDLSIESVRLRLIEIAKFSVHYAVLFALKGWIITAHWVRRLDRKMKDKLTHLLHRNGHLPEGGHPSEFISSVRAHKEEIVAAIEQEAAAEEE